MRLGMGEARLQVPSGTCVLTDAQIGVGAADLPQRADEGFDISIDQAGTGTAGCCGVNANIGVGHLQIDNPGASCA